MKILKESIALEFKNFKTKKNNKINEINKRSLKCNSLRNIKSTITYSTSKRLLFKFFIFLSNKRIK